MNENENLVAINEVLRDMVKNQKEQAKHMTKMFIATVVCYIIILCAMVAGFFWYESQFEYFTTETTTIEQEVSGEGSDINNIQGDQINEEYHDNATKRVGGE